jgi:peptidoglycan/LPS O-acetylase OafA/YrhL
VTGAPSPVAAEFTPAQVTYLNFLRALAALVVLIGHAGQAFMEGTWLASGAMQTMGVIAFFLISGFLITSSVLARRGNRDYGFASYIIDRFFRIFTPFVPALVVVTLVDATVVGLPEFPYARDYNVSTLIANLLMLQDYPVFQVLRRVGVSDQWWFFASFGSARPFWTVAIEWWIYLLFGFVVFAVLGGRAKSPILLLAVGAVLAVVPGYHFVGGYGQCLAMLWMVGMGAAYFWHTQAQRRARHPFLDANVARIGWTMLAFGLVCMAARLFANRGLMYEFQFALFFATSVFGVLLALGEIKAPMPRPIAAPIAFTADFSYSLYLLHFTVIVFVVARYPGHNRDQLMFWAVNAASIALAIVFWALFERHHRALGRIAKGRLRRFTAPTAVASSRAAD